MYRVEIEKLDHFGRGIARIDGKIVFIPKTLVGDVVEINIEKEDKKFLEGYVVNYIKKVKRTNLCPYSNFCGGCSIIDMDYQSQLEYKKQKIEELFNKNLGVDIKINDVITDNNINYRNKISLHIKDKKVGFYKEKSHDLIGIKSCIISKKEINNLIVRLQELVKDLDITDVVIKSHKGTLLDIKGNITKEVILNNFSDCEVIYLNDKLIKGEKTISEEILDKKFMISPKSFFQVNTKVCSKIFSKVRSYIKDKNYNKVLDLYCGTGIIGILISDLVENVVGIEVVSDAIVNANENKKINNVRNINFMCDKVENRINEFKDIDLIIVDPPRNGLDNKSVKSILDINPKDIIYISCNPNTLVRDLKELTKNYEINELSIADMFPNTYHIEVVVFLKKRDLYKEVV